MHSFKEWARWKKFLFYLVIVTILLVELFPIYMIVSTSFKPKLKIWTAKSPIEYFKPTLANYQKVLTEKPFLDHLKNSAIIALATTLISVWLGSLAAYSFARFKFRGGSTIRLGVLASRMIPPIALSVPMYILASQLGLLDQHLTLILAHTSFSLPYVIWLLIPFFKGVPVAFEEAALLDGCGRMKALYLVFLPLVAPGLVVAGIFTFILSWNDFLYALVLTSSAVKTAPVAVSSYMGQFAPDWGLMTAAGTLILLPVFIFALALQKYIVRGLAFGGVK